MKKIYSFLMAFAALATTASAQVVPDGHNFLPRNGWTAVARNETPAGYETAPSGPVAAAIDGVIGSFYHSNWADGSGKTGDQAFKITLPEVKNISGVGYLPRQSGGAEAQKLTAYKIYVSDTEDFDVNALPSVTPTAEGTLTYLTNTDRTQKNIVFDAPVSGKYILVVAQNVTNYFCCAELYLFTKDVVTYNYQVKVLGANQQVTINGVQYGNGATCTSSELQAANVTAPAVEGLTARVDVNTAAQTVTVTYTVDDWANLSNSKAYVFDVEDVVARGNWIANADNTQLTTNEKLHIAADWNSAAQQFAVLKSSNNNYYLYSVGANKFISKSGNYTTFTENPVQPVTYKASTHASYPFIVMLDGQYLNNSPSYTPAVVTNWNNEDAGNHFRIFQVADADFSAALAKIEDFENTAIAEEYNRVKAEAQALITANTGQQDTFNHLTTEGFNAIQAVIPTTDPATNTEKKAKTEEMKNAIAAAKYNFDGYITFQTTQGSSFYLGVKPDGSKFVGQSALTGAQNLWKITSVEGGYAIQNVATQKYVSVPVTSTPNALSDTPVALTLFRESDKVSFGAAEGGRRLMHLRGLINGDYDLVGWEFVSAATKWTITKIEDLTVNVTSELSNYATFSAPFATRIPEGVTAYTGVVNGNSIRLTAISDGVIPANTGVLVKGAEAKAYTFAISENEGTPVSNNAFVASLWEKTNTETNAYTLQNNDGIGFYPYSGTNLLGFKAYVNIPAASPVQGLSLDFGQVTAIEGAAVENAKLEIFDLQGRRVNNAKSGLYIVNGQKVILK